MFNFIRVPQTKLLWAIVFAVFGPLFGMENHACVCEGNRDFAMREVIFARLDHREQRIWAQVNKTYNTIIEDKYRPDKKLIDEFIQQKRIFEITKNFVWNVDFTRCAWFTPTKKRTFYLNLLAVNGNNVKFKSACWDRTQFYVEDKPFFQNGSICIHGYGQAGPNYYERVNKYSLNFDNSKLDDNRKTFSCYVQDRNNVDYHTSTPLGCFLEYPIFLRAILKSKQFRVCSGCCICVYYLEGAMIPENYKSYLCCSYGQHIKTFEGIRMSVGFMQAIEKRLDEQKQEKKLWR